jgi:hypothetical protein
VAPEVSVLHNPPLTPLPSGISYGPGGEVPAIGFEYCGPYDNFLYHAGCPTPATFPLSYIVPAGDNSIQLAWVGDYTYTPPDAVPLPSAFMLLATGLGIVAAWRKRTA